MGPTAHDLVGLLSGREASLATLALAAGLARARPRSSAARVEREAAWFVALFARAVLQQELELRAAVVTQVRSLALAGATVAEGHAVCAIWRPILDAVGRETGRACARAVNRMLDRIETLIADETTFWERDRIDVVVVGGSAGSLVPLGALVGGLDGDLPVSLVIAVHVPPDKPSQLAAVLRRQCALTVAEARDGQVLELGAIYVAAPSHELLVEVGGLRLVQRPLDVFSPTIDVLFASAAVSRGRHVTSIVMSGTGSDGAAGSRQVHERGGVTLAQEPTGATFRGMPDAALATGRIDDTATPAGLASLVESLVLSGRRGLLPRARRRD